MSGLATPRLPAAWGEVFDKLTILEIKAERLTAPDALANVRHEGALLAAAAAPAFAVDPRLAGYKAQLRDVNAALWEVEDALRLNEAAQTFDAAFVELARAVYRHNDRRAALKREINLLLGSEIVEEKSYQAY